jgi:PPK2 family polyphosphate:nucleotide phosphotransferase
MRFLVVGFIKSPEDRPDDDAARTDGKWYAPPSPMKIDLKPYRIPEGGTVNLKDWPTRIKPYFKDKADYAGLLAEHVKKMRTRQSLLYAHNRYSLLLIFQAMDAAGKDGAIEHVMSGVNPQGCQVFSFKHPSAIELDHDFLWRTTRCLPERGRIGIFNRSYYEEVLIVRVHPEILEGQKLPAEALKGDIWKHRYASINDLEKHLYRNGTRILKFFLHLSKGEQRRRFLARIENPDKNWKYSRADIEERGYWKQYQRAYGECLEATSTRHAPWYAVPADDKDVARLIISEAILKTLDGLKMSYPALDKGARKDLVSMHKSLER